MHACRTREVENKCHIPLTYYTICGVAKVTIIRYCLPLQKLIHNLDRRVQVGSFSRGNKNDCQILQ